RRKSPPSASQPSEKLGRRLQLSDSDTVLRDLVVANHALAQEGVVDGFGHISMRNPANPERYFLSRMLAPEQVAIGDLMEFTLDGRPVNACGREGYSERPIHGAIYEARPDVMAVCHNHSPELIPFGLTNESLRP